MMVADDQAARHSYGRLEWLLPVLFAAVLWAQLILSGQRLSQTADEATHLYSGYRYLKCGDLTVSREHPPFAKLVAALPLAAMNVDVDCGPSRDDALHQALTSANWLYAQGWVRVLSRARAAISVFAVGLCLLVWVTARKMFDLETAAVASALLIFEPNVLAYGSLVLTDIPVTCLILLAVLGFYVWADHRSPSFLFLTALATGLALITKHSGVAVLPILGVLAIAHAFGQSKSSGAKWQLAKRNILAVGLIFVLAFGIIWAGYAFRFAPDSGGPAATEIPSITKSALGHVLLELEQWRVLPQAYLRGFGEAVTLSGQGSVAFVAGRIYLHAPWFSTPFNYAIRSTAAMLLMIPAGVFGLVTLLRRRGREVGFVLIPIAVFLAVCIRASNNVSIRYLLPMLPFLSIAVAAGCVELAKQARWLRYGLAGLIVLHAASSIRAYPNYLSYANDLWGGSAEAYKYQPWVDIGQAYSEARTYLEQHPASNCWLITGWHWDPALYDLPCQTSGIYLYHQIPAHVHGTVIVSSTLLTDVRLPEQQLAMAFASATPKYRIGGSALLVYEGDFDTSLNAAAVERNLAASSSSSGSPFDALEHSERELRLAPSSAIAHVDHCVFLAPVRRDAAMEECQTARRLLLSDPLREEASRQRYLELLDRVDAALATGYKSQYRDPKTADQAIPLR